MSGGWYYTNEVWFSPAYQDLFLSSRNLLQCLVSELRWSRKGKIKEFLNNGKVSYTEVDFKKRFSCCSTTYLKARNQLIKVGFIKQTYRGGMCRGDMATYKILITSDLHPREMRWLRYPKENWECDIPKQKKYQVGIGTRFKSKATLINSTHNDELHP